MSGFNMDDYVDVAERIRNFAERFPEGSLQSELELMMDPQGWLCTARAYRTPDDPRPGVGHAFEPIPGKTPYTKDSEAMNAETSAWGRAIVALGFDTKKIASAQEVKARHDAGNGSQFTPPANEAKPQQQTAAAPAATVTDNPGDVVLTFGKHKDTPIKNVPRPYLEWWIAQEPPKTEAQKVQRAAAELFLLGATDAVLAPTGGDAVDDIPFARTFA